MGVPAFFREIFNKYKDTHFWDPKFRSQIFLMDYNAFIHNVYHDYLKEVKYDDFKKLTPTKRDQAIANYVVQRTIDFVNNTARPEKLLYIAIDGPTPKGKMVLSRYRRYMRVKITQFQEEMNKIYDPEPTPESLWSNASISPGTTSS